MRQSVTKHGHITLTQSTVPEPNPSKIIQNDPIDTLKYFTIYHENPRSIMNKATDMRLSTNSLDYDCISINETWLHPSHKNEEFIDNKYNVFRKDRKSSDIGASRGGGVLIAIHKKYDSQQVDFPEINPIEAVCIRVSLPSSNLFIYSLYIQNRISKEHEMTLDRYKNHILALQAVNRMCNPNDSLIILGDFNMPLVKWLNGDDSSNIEEYGYVPVLGESSSVEAKLYREVTSELLDLGLHQMCNFENHAKNVLDLIYTNIPELTSVDKPDMTLFPENFADPAHNPIVCTIECEPIKFHSETEAARYCFRKADYNEINKELSELILNSHSDVNTMVETFYDSLFSIINRHVPKATPKTNNIPIWFDRKLLNLRNIRNREYKKLQIKRVIDINAEDTKFINSKLEFEVYQRELYTDYIRKLAAERKGDPKSFWRYINGKRASNLLPNKLTYNAKIATTNPEKVKLFAEFFSSVYTQYDNNIDLNELIDERFDRGFNKFNITEDAVLNVLSKVDISKGPGHDKIPPVFIRNCAESLTKSLTVIYRISIDKCEYPSRWKIGQITPIFKSGSKIDMNNYRGVTVMSMFAKVYETLIYNQMKLIVYPRLSKNQHGFVPNRNISTNLIELTTFIHQAFEEKAQVDVFYADIRKAFDSVNHNKLIQKIARFPLSNGALNWFVSYLSNRKQFVKLGDSTSEMFDVPSSVGQGSVLGPLLFLIFFDDSDEEIADLLTLNFADDKKVAHIIKKLSDTVVLQNAINKFIQWCDDNDLEVHSMKCQIITFSLKKITIHSDYFIRGEKIKRTENIRDLGVILDPKLSFSQHFEYISNKAHAMLAFVKRQCYKTFNTDIAKMLFYALVRSHLEFASQVWSPFNQKYIDVIESTQKQFIKFIHPNGSANNPRNQFALRPYIERCTEMNMCTLKRRRINACIFLIHDIISGKLSSPRLRNQITFFKINYFIRSPEFIKLNHCTKDCTNDSPFRTACRLYNLSVLHVDPTIDRMTFRDRVTKLPDTVFTNFYTKRGETSR